MEKSICTPTRCYLTNLCILVIFFTTTAHFNLDHTSNSWTGQKSTEWHDPHNWEGGTIPDSNSNVIIPNVSSKKFPTLNGLVQLNQLNIKKGAKLKISMSGILTLKHLINNGWLFGDGTIDGLTIDCKVENYGIIDSIIIGENLQVENKKDGWQAPSNLEQNKRPTSNETPLIANDANLDELAPAARK